MSPAAIDDSTSFVINLASCRKENILAELAETGEPGPSGGASGGQEKLAAQAAAMRELRDLKTDAEAKRELRNEVRRSCLLKSTAGAIYTLKLMAGACS